MNEITAYTAGQIEPAYFNNFVAWIDRSPNTTRAYLINLRQFMAWLKDNGINRPGRNDIISYRDALIAKGSKPNTVTAYIRSVKQFFKWAAANNLYPDIAANVHTPKVDHGSHKKDALTAREVLQVEESIKSKAAEKSLTAATAAKDAAGRAQRSAEQGKRLYAMYLLAVNAGLRTIEISRANVKDIETKGGQAWIYIWGKGRTEPDQKKPLAPEVAQAVRDYLQIRADKPTGASPLFVSTGNRSKGKRIATTTISTMLKRAMQEAGFNSERLTAHSLRHTAGTAVQEITGDIYQTQKYMRHANPATTEIYLHTDIERQEVQTARNLYNHYHGIESSSGQKLQSIISTFTPMQLVQLTNIAAAMV